MIIWSGWGTSAFILPFLQLLVIEFGRDLLQKIYPMNTGAQWSTTIAVLLSSIELYFLSKYLKFKKGRIVKGKNTGKLLELRENHTFFFIEIKYWALFYFLLGIFLFWVSIQT